MINIVIPMAGHGSRFAKSGYSDPKPLISVLGKPMIQLVIENLRPRAPHRFIFLCQASHLLDYPLRSLLTDVAPGCIIIEVAQVTEGAACTVLLAKDFIDNDDPLMIANCDQYIDADINVYLAKSQSLDGFLMTMTAHDTKWSFVGFDQDHRVSRVVEKEVISDEATVGIYNFARGSEFIKAAQSMIAKDLRVNNEFYVAPTYNEMILNGKHIGYFNIGRLGSEMHGIGTPEDLLLFLSKRGT